MDTSTSLESHFLPEKPSPSKRAWGSQLSPPEPAKPLSCEHYFIPLLHEYALRSTHTPLNPHLKAMLCHAAFRNAVFPGGRRQALMGACVRLSNAGHVRKPPPPTRAARHADGASIVAEVRVVGDARLTILCTYAPAERGCQGWGCQATVGRPAQGLRGDQAVCDAALGFVCNED